MQDLQDGFADAWSNIATFLPLLLGALVIIAIGYVVARLLAKAVDAVLGRVGFDRWVERGGVKRALENSSYDASSLLGRLVFYLVMLFVLQLAFGLFGPNPISEVLAGIIGDLPRIFVAIIIVVVGAAVANAVKDMIEGATGGLEYGRTLGLVASGASLVIAGFAALDQLRIAPNIVTGLFYALLAILVGCSVIAFGGGGIPVARRYVEQWARRADEEPRRIAGEASASGTRPRQHRRATGSRAVRREIDLRDRATEPLATDDVRGGPSRPER